MTTDGYRPSSARAIIFGIIGFIILLAIVCGLSEVIKSIGTPFMILPEELGWIPKVNRDDVVTIDMKMSSIRIPFERTGNYAVYGYDYDLLLLTDEMARSNAHPWLNIQNIATSEKINPEFTTRALLPFDSILVRGRPLFQFNISQPGEYQLSFPSRYATIFLLPDQVTGHLGVILFATVVQLSIIAIPITAFLRNIFRKKRARVAEIRNLKRTSNEQFWQELQRKNESGNKKY
jgi:hypothetical protein